MGEGTGLGLNLVKNIVESMNGSIDVTSEIDQGSRFEIELAAVNKFIPSYSNTEFNLKESSDESVQLKKRVMVIDDEPDICDLLEHTLMDDFEILTALSANSAIQQIHDENLTVLY